MGGAQAASMSPRTSASNSAPYEGATSSGDGSDASSACTSACARTRIVSALGEGGRPRRILNEAQLSEAKRSESIRLRQPRVSANSVRVIEVDETHNARCQ